MAANTSELLVEGAYEIGRASSATGWRLPSWDDLDLEMKLVLIHVYFSAQVDAIDLAFPMPAVSEAIA